MTQTPKPADRQTSTMLKRESLLRDQLEVSACIAGFEWFPKDNRFWFSDNIRLVLHEDVDCSSPSLHRFINFFHPHEQTHIQSLLEDLSITLIPVRKECTLLNSGGESHPVIFKAQYDPVQEKIYGFVQDYSFEREKNAELIDTASKYRAVMAGAGDAIVLMSMTGRLMEGNQKAANLLETDQNDISKLSVDDIHPVEDIEKLMGFYQGVLWSQSERLESTLISNKGTRTPVVISGRPVEIDDEKVLIIIFHDISLQIKVQRALMESEQRYRSLVDEALDGIMMLDAQGRILAANPKLCDMTGYKNRHLLKLGFAQISKFEDDINPLTILLSKALKPTMHMEGLLISYQKQEIPTGFNISKVTIEGETKFIVTAYDLSDVRKAEADRLKLQKQLFQAQKQELLGQLAGSLAHDFNNLLSPILLISEMLADETRENAFLNSNLNNIKLAAERARRLVGRILDYTRPELSRPSQIDLPYEIHETLILLRSSVPQTIKIDFQSPEGSMKCFADPDQIHQVMMNIGMNAAQAVQDKSGTITIKLDLFEMTCDHPFLSRFEAPEGTYAHLFISDDGPGINPQDLEKIFDPFFTTKAQTDGSGIGLSVVRQIVDLHNGFCFAENLDPEGFGIHIYLPCDMNG